MNDGFVKNPIAVLRRAHLLSSRSVLLSKSTVMMVSISIPIAIPIWIDGTNPFLPELTAS